MTIISNFQKKTHDSTYTVLKDEKSGCSKNLRIIELNKCDKEGLSGERQEFQW